MAGRDIRRLDPCRLLGNITGTEGQPRRVLLRRARSSRGGRRDLSRGVGGGGQRCERVRMKTQEKQNAEILAKYGEPFASNVWRVQGNAIIYHKCLERIAAQAQITYDVPTVLRAERDEAVILVVGRMGDRTEWSIGEALVNVNYRVSGKQSAYVYAMAEKRAKDRVILKLIQLHGLVYSEEEADEFKTGRKDKDGGVVSSVAMIVARSEERRVGKECRSRW